MIIFFTKNEWGVFKEYGEREGLKRVREREREPDNAEGRESEGEITD